MGAPPSVVGAVEGAAEGAASLTKLVSGPLGDRFARRRLLGLAGYELFPHQIGPLLYLAVIPAGLSVLLISWVRERLQEVSHAPRSSILAGAGRLPRRYWRVISVLLLFGVANFPDALLLMRLKEIGFSVTGVILAYVGYNAVYAVASFPAGVLADRFGGLWPMEWGWCSSRSAISVWASRRTWRPGAD